MPDLGPESVDMIEQWAHLMRETVDRGLVSLSAVFPMAEGEGTLQLVVTKTRAMVIPPEGGPVSVEELTGSKEEQS